MSLIAVVEGDTDEPVIRKLAADAGIELASVLDAGGKHNIDARLIGWNHAAKGSPWLVVRDLDHDAACAPSFVSAQQWKPQRWMLFRLAVRELEAWLLADRTAISRFLGVPEGAIPAQPDLEDDPKQTLVNLARRSRKLGIKRALVPRIGDTRSVGPEFEAAIIEFGADHWNLALAAGTPIVITTLQKFPFVTEKIGQLPGRSCAVIVDEAHSSQTGEAARQLKEVLAAPRGPLPASVREVHRRARLQGRRRPRGVLGNGEGSGQRR